MKMAQLCDVGFRWTKPTWERTADRSVVLIVPSSMLGDRSLDEDQDPRFDRTQRFYDVFNFDGSWFDQLHEMQVERLLKNPGWRSELRPTATA